MSGFKPYPAYKDSGVEWLGEVPVEWALLRLKQVVDPARPITYGIVQAGENLPDGVPYIRPADMTDESGIKNAEGLLRTSPEIARSYSRSSIQFGDIVCSIGPSFGKVMVVPECLDGANLTQGTARVAIGSGFVSRYFFWVLRSSGSYQQWESSVGGATFRALNLGPLSETVVLCPSDFEQTQIARFLDHETARIDALIEEQQRLIELLKEKRQAVISHAVTKGLDPTVPMKDSGVEWLGEVPAHWVVRRIKHLAEVISKGTTPTTIGEDFQDEGIRFLKAENIFGGRVLPDPEFFISECAHAALVRSALAENDVLVVIAGATTGKSAVLSGDLLPANTNQAVSFIRLRDTRLSEFIQCWLSTDAVQRSISLNSVQSAQPNLSMEDLGEIPVPLPPFDEISLITDQLATQISIFDGLISEAVNASGLLQERRSALISAAVTGKIDVRGWQPPASAQAPTLAAEAH